jgi:hypothetical protein
MAKANRTQKTTITKPSEALDAPKARPRQGKWLVLGVVTALVVGGGAALYVAASMPATQSAASFVGSETCAGCHRGEAEQWQNSQHKHAMAHVTDASVLGDFNNASVDYYGAHSRFFRKDG